MSTGRKPMPPALVDKGVFKKNNEEYQARQDSWNMLQTSKVLKTPSRLTLEAKKEWRRVMKLYNQMEADILSDLDQQALIMYCEATAVYEKAREAWSKLGTVVSSNEDHQRMINDALRIMRDQSKIISSLSEQLCLTPVGRARMGMNSTQKEEEDPFQMIMKKRNEAK